MRTISVYSEDYALYYMQKSAIAAFFLQFS